jgi:hypothetical protein
MTFRQQGVVTFTYMPQFEGTTDPMAHSDFRRSSQAPHDVFSGHLAPTSNILASCCMAEKNSDLV